MTVLAFGSYREDFYSCYIRRSFGKDYDNRNFADLEYTPLPHMYNYYGYNAPFELRIPSPGILGKMWFHFYGVCIRADWTSNSYTGTGVWFSVYDAAGNIVADLAQITAGDIQVRSYGDTTVLGTGVFDIPGGYVNYMFDISVEVTATQIITELYIDGILYSTATADNTVGGKGKPSKIAGSFIGMFGSQRGLGLSEFMVTDDEPTFNWRLSSHVAEGAGNYTQWIGTYTALIDKDDGDTMYAAETGIRETWTISAWNSVDDTPLRTILFNFQAWCGPAGPQSVIPFVRIAGVDYELSPVTVTQTPILYMAQWENNPATLLPWETADLVGIEFGVRSGA